MLFTNRFNKNLVKDKVNTEYIAKNIKDIM